MALFALAYATLFNARRLRAQHGVDLECNYTQQKGST